MCVLHLLNLVQKVVINDIYQDAYLLGIRMGSLGLFLQCATSTFFSLIMSRLVRHFGSRWVYLSSMVSFTVSILVICMSKSVVLVTLMASLTGFAYATLQTLPYTLTCHYHKDKEVSTEIHRPHGIICGVNMLFDCVFCLISGLYAKKENQKRA